MKSHQVLFDSLAQAINDKNWDKLPDFFALPTGLYYKDGIHLFTSPEGLIDDLRLYFGELRARGFASLKAQVVVEPLPNAKDPTVWVEWTHYDHDGVKRGASFNRTYCQTSAAGVCKIQLVEMVSYADPQLAAAMDWMK